MQIIMLIESSNLGFQDALDKMILERSKLEKNFFQMIVKY